jgi:hypothetical protein
LAIMAVLGVNLVLENTRFVHGACDRTKGIDVSGEHRWVGIEIACIQPLLNVRTRYEGIKSV